ncbi:hypothetical protein O1M54_02740 [Streptomyces diastatochromogenes]|nr:hypothetical protein [Streptomyces diastatochromogenes]
MLAIRLGDGSPLEDIGEQIVGIHRRRADPAALAYAHCQQAILLWMRGTWDRARTALDLARTLGDDAGDPRSSPSPRTWRASGPSAVARARWRAGPAWSVSGCWTTSGAGASRSSRS